MWDSTSARRYVYIAIRNSNVDIPQRSYLGVNFGLFFALSGLICLILGIYSAFSYSEIISKSIESNSVVTRRSKIKKNVKAAIISGSIGIFISFLGAETAGGVVFFKILATVEPLFYYNKPHLLINLTDVFTILASTNVIVAHCVGLVSSMWSLNQIEQ